MASTQPPVFRASTNLVLIHVNVFDRRSDAVPNLSRDAFKVYEDGVEQTIDFFAAREAPIAAGLAIDNSSSMIARHNMVRAGITAFADAAHDTDEMFTILFNEHVRYGLPPELRFTRSRDLLLSAMAQRPPGGMTALHDAVIEGLSRLAESSNQKRALVVLSDGEDNASRQSESNMLYRAAQSQALIYTIWTGDLLPDNGNPKLLRRLAQRTGALSYSPRSEREVVSTFMEVAENLRRGYSIGYSPANAAADGSYRRVEVTAHANGRRLNVRTRPGYIAGDADVPATRDEAPPAP